MKEAVRFYTEVIGFDDMGFAPAFRMGMVSVPVTITTSVSTPGWGRALRRRLPVPRGLRHFSIDLPDAAELDRAAARVRAAGVPVETTDSGVFLRDPSQNGILLTTAP